MAKKIIKARLKQRTDTQANWAANNPVLLEGELGLVTDDKNLYKVGDGVTAWNDLPFRGFDGTLVHETGDSDNAAMSQRGVTRALAKLEENMANNEKIKELSGKIEQLAEENTRLKERIEEQDVFIEDLEYHKLTANSDNRYPDISVGTADNLAGVDVVDSEINFRRSGGGAITDGVARIETIKGNSVVWNQYSTIIRKAVHYEPSTDIQYLLLGNLPYYTTQINGHLIFSIMLGAPCGFGYLQDNVQGNLRENAKTIYVANTSRTNYTNAYLSVSPSDTDKAFDAIISVLFVDLTKMFGSGNEPTTIEEFYARIPLGVDLNAYNEGEVIHMNVQSIESVGVNQWDEEWEQGGIASASGLPITLAGAIRSKNFSPIFPSTSYYVNWAAYTGDKYIFFYDREQNFISKSSFASNGAVNTPSNAAYFKIRIDQGSSFHKDICINRYDTAINGQYFPYIKRVEDLSIIRKYFPQGMKSAGTAHDEIRYNSATNKWEKVVRTAAVDLGSLKWQYATATSIFYATGSFFFADQRLLCAKYTNIVGRNEDKNSYAVGGSVRILDSAYTDAGTFKASLQGEIMYYELAEPIVTELDAEDQFKDLDYQVWNAGTEKAIAEGKSAPLAADITYGFNAIGKIKELESLVAALRAKVGI